MAEKEIIILTGDECRHKYFRKKVALSPGIIVLASYCEGNEKSLKNRTEQNPNSSFIEKLHVDARTQSEKDFFFESIEAMTDASCPKRISKGSINDRDIINEIISLNSDLLICYGSSLIKSNLLEHFKGRFLNVHLGLSPYYRGSGTNVWPLINKEPHMVGATFMYIDAGIDTGKIIHQIRAEIFLGDSPHTIGNRLIKAMTESYCQIINSFNHLVDEEQPVNEGRLYLQKHFDESACSTLYQNFNDGMIAEYINQKKSIKPPHIVTNSGLR